MTDLPTPHIAPPTPPAWTASSALASNILLWFELLALAIGVAQFVVAPHIIANQELALATLGGLATVALLVRVVPRFKKRLVERSAYDTVALLVMAAVFTYVTGGVQSPLLALFLLPLTGAAIALGRIGYGFVGVTVAVAAVVLGNFTSGVDILSSSFAVWLIGTLAPALIATLAIMVLIEQMQGAERYIQDLSATDRLTGLLNHRAFEEILMREHRKAERTGRPYCVLIIDVDNVKHMNETMGHDTGNKLLSAVAAAIARSIRASDIAARFGGDEFAVLLVDADNAIATTVGGRIRSHVYAGTISAANRMIRANVHLGMACFPKEKRNYKELLVLADQRMRHDRELQRSQTK